MFRKKKEWPEAERLRYSETRHLRVNRGIMNKKIVGRNVYYALGWSRVIAYDRHEASRILPELPGLIMFLEKKADTYYPVLVYATWREGLRIGMRDLFDSYFSKCHAILQKNPKKLLYKYAIIDSSKSDLLDLFFWLIREYQPELNNTQVRDSQRYEQISVKEMDNVKNLLELNAIEFR